MKLRERDQSESFLRWISKTVWRFVHVDCRLQGRRACQKPLGFEALGLGHSVCFAVVVLVVGAFGHSSLSLAGWTKGFRHRDRKL